MKKKFKDEEEESEWYDKNTGQVGLIGQIVACEVAIFLFRRSSGNDFCATVIDDMVRTRRELINKFEKKYGDWKDFNKDVMY